MTTTVESLPATTQSQGFFPPFGEMPSGFPDHGPEHLPHGAAPTPLSWNEWWLQKYVVPLSSEADMISDFGLVAGVPFLIFAATYLFWGFLFFAVEHLPKPERLQQYIQSCKCQPSAKPVSVGKHLRILAYVAWQFALVYPPAIYLVAKWSLGEDDIARMVGREDGVKEKLTSSSSSSSLPDSAFALFAQLLLAALFAEVYFYHVHLLLHKSTFLYQNVHKKHHEIFNPVCFAALYFHPVESVLLIPVAAGPVFLFKLHCLVSYPWFFVAASSVTLHHSGFHLEPRAKAHDEHHRLVRVDFGTLGICDWLFGTGHDKNKG
mmetsp:Transcript_18575/g.46342  ORF Transcript_18575/g.46342 Transcript_18575/m.46342 type:complete len:320 (-) Transcript_18575:754-1713(-)|eukprot:g12338.t1